VLAAEAEEVVRLVEPAAHQLSVAQHFRA